MSQFINQTDDYSSEFTTGIDFDDAVKLPGGGSTCDIFKTRWQRRDVFVKRLKEDLRSKQKQVAGACDGLRRRIAS